MTLSAVRYEAEVIDYFKHKAEKYDLVDKQIYWVLSDTLLWFYFKQNVLDRLPESFSFLDAGGGTGRWTLKILAAFPKAKGLLFDLSADMTQQALKKADNYSNRLTVVNGNLNVIKEKVSAQFDLIFNFHNVMGFVENPQQVVQDLASLLCQNGYLVSLLPNKYHCLYFNLAINAIPEARHILANGNGRFTNTMPYMNLFTPESSKALYEASQLSVERLTGFPNFIYPGHQETQLEGSTVSLESVLIDNFDAILEMEMAYLNASDIAARGNNIFIAGKKTAVPR